MNTHRSIASRSWAHSVRSTTLSRGARGSRANEAARGARGSRANPAFALASPQMDSTARLILRQRWKPVIAAADHSSPMDRALRHFKMSILAADREIQRNGGTLSATRQEELAGDFRDFCELVNYHIGDGSTRDAAVREELGAQLKAEMLPYLLLAETAERFYSKPRGYAGDFLTIQMIYDRRPAGRGRIGSALDQCFLSVPAAQAVRNRRGLLAEEIGRTCQATDDQTVRITSLACGPAAEIFDVLATEHAPRLVATLVDIDYQALAFVTDQAARRRFQQQVRPAHGNLLYLTAGRQHLDLPPQDLVYSIGLIDYFKDAFVVKLLDYIHGMLKPGGRVILGNFHPRNSTKALMDYVLDWRLIHRSEDDMNRLFCQSRFGRPCSNIRFEAEGINLFAECVR